MHPDQLEERLTRIQNLHDTWCGLTRTLLPLTRPRIAAWNTWIDHNPQWGTNHLLATVVYLRARMQPCEFADLIQQPLHFAELLEEARKELHLRAP